MVKLDAIHPQKFGQKSVGVLGAVPKIVRQDCLFERQIAKAALSLKELVRIRMRKLESKPTRWRTLTSTEELALGVGHRLDHVLSVARVEEKLSTFGIRNEFNEVRISAYR